MADDRTDKTTIRLNVLGPLEVAVEPGGKKPLPTSARAQHLLALFAVEKTYDKQQLVNYLWPPGEDVNHHTERERKRTRGKIDKELSNARAALKFDEKSGFLGSSGQLVAHRSTGQTIEVISDLDQFRDLAQESRGPVDWRMALALVRGEVAEHLPDPADVDRSWLDRERKRQRKDITKILEWLHLDTTKEELNELCQDVLDGRYQSPEQPVSAPFSSEPLAAPDTRVTQPTTATPPAKSAESRASLSRTTPTDVATKMQRSTKGLSRKGYVAKR